MATYEIFKQEAFMFDNRKNKHLIERFYVKVLFSKDTEINHSLGIHLSERNDNFVVTSVSARGRESISTNEPNYAKYIYNNICNGADVFEAVVEKYKYLKDDGKEIFANDLLITLKQPITRNSTQIGLIVVDNFKEFKLGDDMWDIN